MRIGELASRTGVSVRSLRYYEQQGLLIASRTAGGQREYPEQAVDRVIRIQELFAAGLHSKKIAQLLPCMRDADGGPSEIATPRLLTELVAERARIDRTIAELANSRDVLDEVIDAAAEPSATGPAAEPPATGPAPQTPETRPAPQAWVARSMPQTPQTHAAPQTWVTGPAPQAPAVHSSAETPTARSSAETAAIHPQRASEAEEPRP